MRTVFAVLCALWWLAAPVQAQDAAPLTAPDLVLHGISFEVSVPADSATAQPPVLQLEGRSYPLTYDAAAGVWTTDAAVVDGAWRPTLRVVRDGAVIAATTTRGLPGWLSILPPLLAIVIALIFRRVVPALFLGIWVGAWMAIELSLTGAFVGLLESFQVYVLGALADESHAAIILFSLMIGGMVGIISKNGGTYGIVDRITAWADNSRRGQVATGLMGVGIFFDDYANTLVVGNTMRPVTDQLRISREKLAYIVDSTAAPVACLAFVTTWIGYEVGLVGTAVASIEGFSQSAYSIFLQSIPYSFYPILALYFVFAIASSRREFGPMRAAEERARTTGDVLGPNAKVDAAAAEGDELEPPADIPRRAFNAIVPVVVLVGSVLASLYVTGAQSVGYEAPLREIIGAADSYKSLMWGSLLGVLAAAVLSFGQRLLSLEEVVEAWYAGLKSMLFAMIILVLAWSLSSITEVLHTADFLVSVLGDTLPPGVVPAIIFVLAAATAFATGSSWGTMGILMPLVVPLSWAVLVANGMGDPAHYHIIYSSISCVLAGSVWGDHCSPISDTTILSSMASGCDHIEHVRTQLPYALAVGVVALLLGTLPAGFGISPWILLPLGMIVLSVLLRTVGTPVAIADTADEAAPA
ncbi:Na+/H+ antiporter NhaC family protein [Salisaeta longa]|uniref:Na+/H+ antiporter NhaC family protein n=1 Tax=Salisaeta longa TaxID=503170 RepID=UPI0003B387CE|nr:Na+/H+ antiporter NhaC family protein [Salisaeta longa]